MKNIIIFLITILSISCNSQQNVTAVKDNDGNLIGIANKESFIQEPYAAWFQPNYTDFQPNEKVIRELKNHIEGVKIKAFMGTWCGDSKRETPAFYKILDAVEFDYKNLEMITVNRSKSTPDNLQEGFDIARVPTFIFYKNEIEIGRYVEYPRESLEDDILAIVSGKPYKHSYED